LLPRTTARQPDRCAGSAGGTVVGLGDTIVTMTVTDAENNTRTCEVTVTVIAQRLVLVPDGTVITGCDGDRRDLDGERGRADPRGQFFVQYDPAKLELLSVIRAPGRRRPPSTKAIRSTRRSMNARWSRGGDATVRADARPDRLRVARVISRRRIKARRARNAWRCCSSGRWRRSAANPHWSPSDPMTRHAAGRLLGQCHRTRHGQRRHQR